MKHVKGYTQVGNAITILAAAIVGATGYGFSENIGKEAKKNHIYIEQIGAPTPSDTYVIKEFFGDIDNKNMERAYEKLALDENGKKEFSKIFEKLDFIKIRTIEPFQVDTWNGKLRKYFLRINLHASEKGTTPYWENEENARIITVANKDGQWLIKEIAKAP